MPVVSIAHATDSISLIDEYRFYARECVTCAEETSDPKHRELFLEMAQAWTRLVTAEMCKPENKVHPLSVSADRPACI